MKNPLNRIDSKSQSKGIEGYVFDGRDGSQMAFWTCNQKGRSEEHVHDYDEYFTVVEGTYTLVIHGKKMRITKGMEYHIPKGILHSGEFEAGTRTIHAFGGQRVKR